jgi:hypothetical protein
MEWLQRGLGLLIGFIGLWYSMWLRFTLHYYTHARMHTHTLLSRVMSSLTLLSSHFQWHTFPFLWVLKLFPTPNSNNLPQLNTNSFQTNCNSKSKLCYDQRQSVGLSRCQETTWGPRPDFYYCQTVQDLLMWGTLSDERVGLSFKIAAVPHQRSQSWVQVHRTHDHILLSQIWDSPNLEGQVPKEQGGPVIPQGIGFPFHHLILLIGLQQRYSNPPPCRD